MYTQTHTDSSRTDITFAVFSIWHVAVVAQWPSHAQLFATPWIAACHTSLSLTISRSLPEFISIASVMPSSHLIIWYPLLLLPSIFPSIRNFPMSQLFASDNQNTGVSDSASVLPSIQDWFPLRLTSLMSLLSRGLSGVFSSNTVQRPQFFGILPSLWSSSQKHMWPLGKP